MYQDLK
jgi:hypothetical protein